jgi:hypothetical protein
MENNELKFYWYPGENTDGVNFKMDEEYVLSDIKRILIEKNNDEINGFFINFGKPFLSVNREVFHRIIIKKEDDGQFLEVIERFSYPDFEPINTIKSRYPNLPDSICDSEESRRNVKKGERMLDRFGVFKRKNNQDE